MLSSFGEEIAHPDGLRDIPNEKGLLDRFESVPEMVTMCIEPATGAASAKIIVGGFLPHTTYHKYEDDYHNHTSDS